MGFFINGKAVDSADSNWSGTLKNIRSLTSKDDINLIKEQGIYNVNLKDGRPINSPKDELLGNHDYWTLLVLNHDDGQIHQFIFSQSNLIWRWLGYNNPQMDWEKIVYSSDIQKLEARIQTLENKIGR